MTDIHFESKQICRITGIPERTLRYLADRQVIKPSIADVQGRPGKRRKFSLENLVEIALAEELFSYGITVSEMRDILRFVKKAKLFILQAEHLWLVIQDGRVVGVLAPGLPQTVQDELKRKRGKWYKDLSQGRNTRVSDRLESILEEGAGGVSFLMIAFHHVKEETLQKVQEDKA